MLLGILEPEETVLLSTHLLEEVEHFYHYKADRVSRVLDRMIDD